MNKEKFVPNVSQDEDNTGSKWSLDGLKEHWNSIGVNYDEQMEKIYDICVKTFIGVRKTVAAVTERLVPFRSNCFELFGFDILFDEKYNPWLLEVNLTPSLICDSPLDYKIKGQMVCDIFNMVGLVPCPMKHAEEFSASDDEPIRFPGNPLKILKSFQQAHERRGDWNLAYPASNHARYEIYDEMKTPLNLFIASHLLASPDGNIFARAKQEKEDD
eukprot:TRINITY_DN10488_c0_g1_i3.p1 TRINITY_DN10488_c0_g1~~TRINITY_DN10488_c0_g1_i3.p1  ORF type:complete len:216 (-),score=70.18 TRINITY_DN10488_c0_g1_i3:7-654(-)